MSDHLLNVLFLCTGNSARSILAESILRKELQAFGYPIDNLHSKSWDEFAVPGAQPMDFVFTVCGNAAGEACPIWPGRPMTAHWGIEDPASVEGSDLQKQAAFVTAANYLKNRITAFINLPVKSLDKISLTARLGEIGKSEGASGAAT